MLDRDRGQIVFHCDGKRCAEVFCSGTNDFHEALEMLKDDDWQVRNIKGEWLHVCPSCQEEETRGLAL